MQLFQTPAARDKFRGQPVEQFGMSGPFAELAEIARRRYQTPAEMMHPDAIDENATGQRMARSGEPARERQSSACGRPARLLDDVQRHTVQDGQPAWRDHLLRLVRIAAMEA